MSIRVCGDARLPYLNQVFQVYCVAYASIGTHYKNPYELFDKTFLWDIELNNKNISAFMLYRMTEFGLKSVAMATDSSLKGKFQLINLLRMLGNEGYFGEMSGMPAVIAHKLNLPIVHVNRVESILKKKINPLSPVTYARHISGLNEVKEKTMFGVPFGVLA